MTLIEALEQGTFHDFGQPDHVIETLLSKVFFFGDRVIKVYKHKEAFYGNLADPSFRKTFYAEDFFWNHEMAPDIYQKLIEVDGDHYIEMRNVDATKNLTNLFADNTVSVSDIHRLTTELVTKLRQLTTDRKAKLHRYFEMPWITLQDDDFEDLRQWAYIAESIPRSTTDEIVNLLIRAAHQEPYFTAFDQSLLSAAIDNNPDNLLILNGKPGFIDIMTPKDNWKVADEFFTVARTAVDAYVLGSEAHGNAVYATYDRKGQPPIARLVYEIRTGLIQWPYRVIVNQPERAEKYKTFVLNRVQQLKQLV